MRSLIKRMATFVAFAIGFHLGVFAQCEAGQSEVVVEILTDN